MIRAGVAATILPPATTYLRAQWKKPAESTIWRMDWSRIPTNISGCGSLANCDVVVPSPEELRKVLSATFDVMERAILSGATLEQMRHKRRPSLYDFLMSK